MAQDPHRLVICILCYDPENLVLQYSKPVEQYFSDTYLFTGGQVESNKVEALAVEQLQLGAEILLMQVGNAAVRLHHHYLSPCHLHMPRLLEPTVAIFSG